jgi:hypothetical protein
MIKQQDNGDFVVTCDAADAEGNTHPATIRISSMWELHLGAALKDHGWSGVPGSHICPGPHDPDAFYGETPDAS